MDIFGYFTSADQATPAFDPGLDVLCPVCLRPLSAPMKTPSLLLPGDDRSFFYRVHKDCYADADAIERIESSLIDTRAMERAAVDAGKAALRRRKE